MTPDALIQKFFSKGLTPEEQQELDRYLAAHPEAAEAFALEKDVQAALVDQGKDNLRKRLKNRESEALISIKSEAAQETSRRSFIKYAIAAAVIIGTTLFIINNYNASSPNHDDLYAAYFEPYRNVIAPIERGSPAETLEERTFRDYELGKYEDALRGFQELNAIEKKTYYNFYKGISLMQLGRYDEAATLLEDYPIGESRFYLKSRWYLALCQIKDGNSNEAISILTTIAASTGYKSREAQELLSKL